MFKDVEATDLAGHSFKVRLFEVPDLCPRCYRNILPKFVTAALWVEQRRCQAIFRCTHQACQELFIGMYHAPATSSGARQVTGFTLESLAPLNVRTVRLPETVQTVSPTFIEIYDQATAAESHDLSQLVGIGLRKALEFLIKDFAVSENPGQDTGIRNATLANCISNYIVDNNIKDCAKRAAWLGNDETHYTRKWETKDINDLKILIKLTVNWIDNFILTKKYLAEMP